MLALFPPVARPSVTAPRVSAATPSPALAEGAVRPPSGPVRWTRASQAGANAPADRSGALTAPGKPRRRPDRYGRRVAAGTVPTRRAPEGKRTPDPGEDQGVVRRALDDRHDRAGAGVERPAQRPGRGLWAGAVHRLWVWRDR